MAESGLRGGGPRASLSGAAHRLSPLAAAVVAVLLPARTGLAQAGASGPEMALSLQHNVVSVFAEWESGEVHHGFGFLVGEDGGYAYFATADHVVRGALPGQVSRRPRVRHFGDESSGQLAELLGKHDEEADLAIVRVPATARRLWRRDALAPVLPDPGDPVWFVGRSARWFVPEQPGRVRAVSGTRLVAQGLPVRVGTSGAPLIAREGIVGMVVADQGTESRALGIVAMRRAVEGWEYPFDLRPREPEIDVSGDWLYSDEDGNSASVVFDRSGLAHFRYRYDDGKGETSQGEGVIDGDEVRFWTSNNLFGLERGVARVSRIRTDGNRRIALVIQGTTKDAEDDYYFTLSRAGSEGRVEGSSPALPGLPFPEVDEETKEAFRRKVLEGIRDAIDQELEAPPPR